MTYEMALQSLRNDLTYAWEYRNQVVNNETMEFEEETNTFKRLENSQDFFYSIDPENMAMLKAIKKSASKSYSTLGLAMDILRGKKIKF